jgi:uncharacterized membrane protein
MKNIIITSFHTLYILWAVMYLAEHPVATCSSTESIVIVAAWIIFTMNIIFIPIFLILINVIMTHINYMYLGKKIPYAYKEQYDRACPKSFDVFYCYRILSIFIFIAVVSDILGIYFSVTLGCFFMINVLLFATFNDMCNRFNAERRRIEDRGNSVFKIQ